MTNPYKQKISDSRQESTGITKQQINNHLMLTAYPAIYIETQESLEIINSNIITGGEIISTLGLTVLETVKRLRDNGITAYVSKDSISMLPAESLVDFSNRSTVLKDIDISPKNIDEIHGKGVLNIPGLEETSIRRSIVSMHSDSIRTKYSKNEGRYSFKLVDDKIYTNGLRSDTKAVVDYKIDKFFLFINKENIIELNSVLRSGKRSLSRDMLTDTINSQNWDKI